jgi:hypothetical protein
VHHHIAAHLNTSYPAAVSTTDALTVDSDSQILQGTFQTISKHRSNAPEGLIKPVFPEAVGTLADDTYALPDRLAVDVYHADREHLGWHGIATSGFMFRREMLELIVPNDNELFRVHLDYYLASFSHALTGTLIIGTPLFCYRRHGTNKFANLPTLGGDFQLGTFTKERRRFVERAIARHVVENETRFVEIVGLHECARVIYRFAPRDEIYSLVKDRPLLRRFLGSGSEWRFRVRHHPLLRWAHGIVGSKPR